MSIIQYVYVPGSRKNVERKGQSEAVLKRRLQRAGWRVCRGGYLHCTRKEELYPNVQKAYSAMAELLEKHHPGTLELLQYFCVVHHGMPDLLCYRQGVFKFVECKLEHEQLLDSQKKCIPRLMQLGFTVEVHKLVDGRTKTRHALVDVVSGEKRVSEHQTKLSAFTGQRKRKRVKAQRVEAAPIIGEYTFVAVH